MKRGTRNNEEQHEFEQQSTDKITVLIIVCVTANINASLMTFGRCLEALRWNQQHSNPTQQRQVPFRDSKLTRLFQDYFIGNGKAVMYVVHY